MKQKLNNLLLLTTLIICLLPNYYNSACAQLYQHCGYSGKSKLYCGSVSWVGSSYNDMFSAIRLFGTKNKITIWQHSNFQGKFMTFDRDVDCLTGYGFNDIVSSLRVTKKFVAEKPCAKLYQHCGYWGKSRTYCGDANWVGNGYNDMFSAIKLIGNSKITVWKHSQYGGKSKTFYNNVSCLTSHGFNDIISSLKVRRK